MRMLAAMHFKDIYFFKDTAVCCMNTKKVNLEKNCICTTTFFFNLSCHSPQNAILRDFIRISGKRKYLYLYDSIFLIYFDFFLYQVLVTISSIGGDLEVTSEKQCTLI